MALSNEVIEVDSKYETLVKKVLGVIDFNTKTLNLFMKENIIELSKGKEERDYNSLSTTIDNWIYVNILDTNN